MTRQEKLLEAIQHLHRDQQRKYTGEPYWYHLVEVAEMMRAFNIPLLVEAAYCHDVLEDTDISSMDLTSIIYNCGYETWEAMHIVSIVLQLTDVYTAHNYPNKNRKERKRLEAVRLSTVTAAAHTLKYGDLISNTKSILEHDAEFSVVYVDEKIEILRLCKRGDPGLYSIALGLVSQPI